MSNIFIYDTHVEDEAVLRRELSSHTLTFFTESIALTNIHEDAEVISLFVTSTLTREMIEKMPHLKLVACRSTGFNNVDLVATKERDIKVVNVPSYGENTVAEYAFALLLALTRKVSESTRLTKENKCVNPEKYIGVDLSGKTLAVLGTGRIGKKAISIARGFEMNVLAYDPHPDEAYAKEKGYTYASLEEVLQKADMLTLHMPLNEDTRHLLSKDKFALLKEHVIIVNTARGELIDTKALVNALDAKKIGAVALDVCEGEELLRGMCRLPDIHDSHSRELMEESLEISALKSFSNVILSPHLAYNTKEAVGRINMTTAQNIQAFFGGSLQNEVIPAKAVSGKLVLVRHTESEWNQKGMWTGTRDVKLSEKGFEDARVLGQALADIPIQKAFISEQNRTMETLSSLLGSMGQPIMPIVRDKALNERDYGEYTGKNKKEMKEILGDEDFERVRRGWDVAIPQGETLKNVYDRIVPFYKDHILPVLLKGENIIVVSHGNALRALIKYIEKVSDEDIVHVEMMFGGALVYRIDEEGYMKKKEIRETPNTTPDTHV
jgi:D-lactate dehydrogenase